MKFQPARGTRDLLPADAVRMLYAALHMGGFLAVEGIYVENAEGGRVDRTGSRDSLEDALGMLYGAVDYALLSHNPAASFLAMGAGYWHVAMTKINAKTMKVSISGPSRSKVKELKGIVDAYLVPKGSIPPQPEAPPADDDIKSS